LHFQIGEYKELEALIEKSTLAYTDFDFIKKRGWVNIRFQKDRTFRFLRERITELDADLQWQFKNPYQIEIAKERSKCANFQEVLSNF